MEHFPQNSDKQLASEITQFIKNNRGSKFITVKLLLAADKLHIMDRGFARYQTNSELYAQFAKTLNKSKFKEQLVDIHNKLDQENISIWQCKALVFEELRLHDLDENSDLNSFGSNLTGLSRSARENLLPTAAVALVVITGISIALRIGLPEINLFNFEDPQMRLERLRSEREEQKLALLKQQAQAIQAMEEKRLQYEQQIEQLLAQAAADKTYRREVHQSYLDDIDSLNQEIRDSGINTEIRDVRKDTIQALKRVQLTQQDGENALDVFSYNQSPKTVTDIYFNYLLYKLVGPEASQFSQQLQQEYGSPLTELSRQSVQERYEEVSGYTAPDLSERFDNLVESWGLWAAIVPAGVLSYLIYAGGWNHAKSGGSGARGLISNFLKKR